MNVQITHKTNTGHGLLSWPDRARFLPENDDSMGFNLELILNLSK